MTRHAFAAHIDALDPFRRVGHVRKVSQTHIEATGPLTTVGDICAIQGEAGAPSVLAEVTAVESSHIVLVPLEPATSIRPDARIVAMPGRSLAPVGDAFAGRAVNALAEPIDNGACLLFSDMRPLEGRVLAPMERIEPDRILETGVRAIDGGLSIGRGQRIGIFAASGVGKTTLVRQLAAQIASDRCVLCLVGERGREVEAAWRESAASPSRDKFTCVAATSDLSAVLRVRAVHQALCLAEYWRDRGEHVVLIVDSVTRYAMAMREIGLASGEPPTLRAYTPNVFSALPRLVERCGAARAGGSITAIIAVLSETDDVDDPIAETMKSLLDGHIILSRQLAEQGHFPAIDLTKSISRLSEQIMAPNHATAARRAVALLATYEEARLMIESGVYKTGANPRIDEAVRGRDNLLAFLKQRSNDRTPLSETVRMLNLAVGGRR